VLFRSPVHDVIYVNGEDSKTGYSLELAMQYSDSYNEITLTFANNIRTIDGGTHLSGFKTALTRCLNAYAKRSNLLKEKDPTPTGDDLREGLAAVISVKLPEPQFEGQTKGKLRNTDVEGFVSSMVNERLGQWLEEHPSEAKKICQKGVLAAQAREAARRARELTRRKSALESGAMPHKLRDCTTKDVERSEMFIVEGDSAGGSATQGRDVETQAILPLRGKLLNVERARLDKILAFEELRTLISALKCGIGEEFDIAKLRYGRIIIMTDADVDGLRFFRLINAHVDGSDARKSGFDATITRTGYTGDLGFEVWVDNVGQIHLELVDDAPAIHLSLAGEAHQRLELGLEQQCSLGEIGRASCRERV